MEINNLTVQTNKQKLLLNAVSLKIPFGDITGLTGASGSGKTTLIKQILGMPDNNCKRISGEIIIDGQNTESLNAKSRRMLNGSVIGYIPQTPMTAFDSRVTVGRQMTETFRIKKKLRQPAALSLAEEMLRTVNLTDIRRVLNSYPGELSGGMLQRIAFSISLGLEARYLLADEPTSALDEDNKDLLFKLIGQNKSKMGILFVSHDVHALCSLSSGLYIMQNGKVIEEGNAGCIFECPEQMWTKQFVAAGSKKRKEGWIWTESAPSSYANSTNVP